MATFNVPGNKIESSYAELRYFKGASATTFASVVGAADYTFNDGFAYDITPKFAFLSNWSFLVSLIRPLAHPWPSANPQAFLDATTTPGAGLSILVVGPTFWPGMYAMNPATVTSDVPPPLVPATGVAPVLIGGCALAVRRKR
ncbi:MAG: hypothetical protein KF691_10110 [Phycisphaeraceae bacterium]|nr:hypothetical protein [Phycisphaeraceae bacterium]